MARQAHQLKIMIPVFSDSSLSSSSILHSQCARILCPTTDKLGKRSTETESSYKLTYLQEIGLAIWLMTHDVYKNEHVQTHLHDPQAKTDQTKWANTHGHTMPSIFCPASSGKSEETPNKWPSSTPFLHPTSQEWSGSCRGCMQTCRTSPDHQDKSSS